MIRLSITVAVLSLALGMDPGAQTSDVELDKLFAGAQHKASVEGDPKRAIADYELILSRAGENRAAAARALMGIADAYRVLGDTREQDVLTRIVSNYREQPAAATARARLAVLTSAAADARSATGMSSRAVWTLPGALAAQGHVSRDGRWLPYVDWSTNNLALRDFQTGKDIALTDTGVRNSIPKQQYPGYSRISPDGKKIAFGWFNSERYDVRLLDIATPGRTRPVTLYHNPDVEYIHPFAWSPDGAWLAVGLRRVDRTGQLALLSVRDGSLQVLRSFPWRDEMSGVAFSPDGKWVAYDLPPEDNPRLHDVYAISVDGLREITVAAHRRNDSLITWSRDGRDIVFSSDRTGQPQLWAQRIQGGELQGPARSIVSDFNGTFLGMSDDGAFFDILTTRSSSLFRLADFDVRTGRVTSKATDPGEEYFSTNLRAQGEWSHDGRLLALARRTGADPLGMLVSILGPDGTRVRDLRPQVGFGPFVWSRDGKSFLAPGEDLKGRAGILRVDAVSGAGEIMAAETGSPGGLAVLGDSADGRHLYYGRIGESGLRLIDRELESGTEREIATLSGGDQPRVPGFWNPQMSPDGRYIVASEMKDEGRRTLIIVAVSSGQRRVIAPGDDFVLMWAPDSRSVFARRGADSARVFRLSVDTGETNAVEWTPGADNHSFRLHPDGRRLLHVVTTASATSQVRRLTGIASQLQGTR